MLIVNVFLQLIQFLANMVRDNRNPLRKRRMPLMIDSADAASATSVPSESKRAKLNPSATASSTPHHGLTDNMSSKSLLTAAAAAGYNVSSVRNQF